MYTPWGKSDYQKTYIENGIVFHGTPSHGGFKVYKKYNHQIPEYMRNSDGWYEEDCEWCKVAIIFPELFVDSYSRALDTFRNWLPDEYQKYFGITLRSDESYILKERELREASKDKYVVTSAMNTFDGNVKVHAVRGGRLENGQYASNDEKWFLVPKHEYNSRHFVIDETNHIETTAGF